MTREWKLFIQDIYDAIQHIKGFIGNMSFKKFLTDEKTRSAVVFKTITSVASLGSDFQLCKRSECQKILRHIKQKIIA